MSDVVAGGDAAAVLRRLEERLDPARPEDAGVAVLAYGEISAALRIPDAALAGVVAKRMSGFRNLEQVHGYTVLLEEYLTRLRDLGIHVLPTQVEPVDRAGRGPVVYLLQPQVPADRLGHHLLTGAEDDTILAAVRAVLEQIGVLLDHNAAHPDDEISVDAQLSNWSFPSAGQPVLLDVGTPFIRRASGHAFDTEIVLSAVPPVLRAYYRRRVAGAYMDDYFSARHLCLDLLGNFAKEGARGRTGLGLQVCNAWLAERHEQPITAEDAADYYRSDAATLELFLKVRKADRFVRRLLRQRYDYILPGPVQR